VKPGFPTPLREGCAFQTLPLGEGMGKPDFPIPLREGQAFPRAGAWGKPVSPHPCLTARPSRGRGCGGTWFPHVHTSVVCRQGSFGSSHTSQVHCSELLAGRFPPEGSPCGNSLVSGILNKRRLLLGQEGGMCSCFRCCKALEEVEIKDAEDLASREADDHLSVALDHPR